MPSPLLTRARPYLEAGLPVIPSLGGKPSLPDAWDTADGVLLPLGPASDLDALTLFPTPDGHPTGELRQRLGLFPSFRSPSGTEYVLAKHRQRPHTVLHKQARYLSSQLLTLPDFDAWDPFCPPTRANLANIKTMPHPDTLLPFSLGERASRKPSLPELIRWSIEVHQGDLVKAWEAALVFNQGTMGTQALKTLFRTLTLKTYATHG